MRLDFYQTFPGFALLAATLFSVLPATGQVVFETTSPYHHIRVIDEQGIRTLSFDNSMETRMSLRHPLQGHFEYTEFFQLPWLWNTQLCRVAMIGLGGASTQRAYRHYYPKVAVDTAEIDPVVVQIARDFFHYTSGSNHQVHITDGRAFVRRCRTPYDALILDAYVQSRYGSFIPYHLATREFFELAHRQLTTNGLLAYNIIGTVRGWQADMVGALYRTLNAVFPQVYLFPARTSQNVVLLATKTKAKADLNVLRRRAAWLLQSRRLPYPPLADRLLSLQTDPPPNHLQCPVLTDDFAPIDGLLRPR